MLIDSKERAQALDPNSSFIVQAPAGSGKTELLTQRFLALLPTVEYPEQIIAITFTKKAANEMQTRIINTLKLGLKPSPPDEGYLYQSWLLAKKALQQDEKQQWGILNQPSRLKIKTIDSLCQSIINAMPLTSKGYAYLNLKEDAIEAYQLAAQNCLTFALENSQYQTDCEQLLLHLGNHQERLLALFSDLLAKRASWLPSILKAKGNTKERLESALYSLHQHALIQLNKTFPFTQKEPLIRLIHYALAFIEKDALLMIFNAEVEAGTNPQNFTISQWQAIGKWLLSTKFELRKRFTQKEGFPANAYFKSKAEKELNAEMKSLMNTLLAELTDNTAFIEALEYCLRLPPANYDKKQWNIIQALINLLPLLAAHLELCFSEKQYVDFNAISQSALEALGSEEEPTDLSLYLDYKISHLLIDEFQDTSNSQFLLLERLTAGWQSGDGRTLFLVGDPMQSIYRFRQADVGLFLKAKAQGVAAISLKFLKLVTNFRSKKGVVDYINQKFSNIFPKFDDMDSGAISYHPSNAFDNLNDSSPVSAYQSKDAMEEAFLITELIKKYHNKSIAILSRSRAQLSPIIKALKQKSMAFEGVDIDNLYSEPVIQDLFALTKILLDPQDKLAQFTLLHSPWCGLNYDELYLIESITEGLSFIELINANKIAKSLSKASYLRLSHVVTIIKNGFLNRDALSFTELVFCCFQRLGGAYHPKDKHNIESYFELLDKHSTALGLKDLYLFEHALNKLYAKSKKHSHVQLMTIHKSKGLEFDIVILPSLEKTNKGRDVSLFEFMEINSLGSQKTQLLLAPLKSIHEQEDKIYQFVTYLHKKKELHEHSRLLYVALTRAKEQLILLTSHSDMKKLPKNSFLAMLKPQITPYENLTVFENEDKIACYQRLPRHWFLSDPIAINPNQVNNKIKFNSETYSQLLGIFIHEKIKMITEHQIKHFESLPRLNWQSELINLGIESKKITEAMQTAEQAIKNLLQDKRGLWLIAPHQSSFCEYELIDENGKFIIDRTFIDKQGIRWIVDYKLGQSPPSHYFSQLQTYAALLAKMEKKLVRCGLYYPLTKEWFEFKFIKAEDKHNNKHPMQSE